MMKDAKLTSKGIEARIVALGGTLKRRRFGGYTVQIPLEKGIEYLMDGGRYQWLAARDLVELDRQISFREQNDIDLNQGR